MKNRRESKKWMKLDNAAKIYPAAKKRNWTALFRISAELTEEIDPAVLEEAQRSVIARFPGFAQKLRRGMFWYYLEQNDGAPDIQKDVGNPCVRMNLRENRRFMFRVRYYEKRIAVEIFHVLSDGTGGLCFLKTLVAEYLRIKYGAEIPRGKGILDCSQAPKKEELEDAYLKYAKNVSRSRSEDSAFYIKGTDEAFDVVHITTGIIPVKVILQKAKEKGVTLTEYLTAVMLMSLAKMQKEANAVSHRQDTKPLKVCVPINLRQFYPCETLRNFAIYVNPGIDTRYGDYTFDEVLKHVHCYMGMEVTEKMLNAKIAANVKTEKNKVLRVVPLFVKNIAMKITFNMVGDRQTSTSISNLGRITLPEEMAKYVTRMDFILGPYSRNKVVLAAASYGEYLYANFTRTIREATLEREFFRYLIKEGVPVKIESNRQY